MLVDRYLIRETGRSVVVVSIILTAVFAAYSLTRFLADAAGGLLSAPDVARLTGFKALIALEVLLPMALFFGVIAGFDRLNQHSELTAMRACGLPVPRLARAPLLLAVLVATAVGVLSISARPWAYEAMFQIRDRARAAAEIDRIRPQRFYLEEDDARTIYVEESRDEGRALRGLFIQTRQPDGLEIITAPRGELVRFVTPTRHRLVLHDALIFRDSTAPPDLLGRFAELTLSLDATASIDREYRTKAAATGALFGSASADDRAELQWRLSTPVSTLLLALTALALVDYRPRRGRFARLPHALGIYAVYYNLLGVGRTWVEQGVLAALWWVPAALAAGLVLHAAWRRRPVRAP